MGREARAHKTSEERTVPGHANEKCVEEARACQATAQRAALGAGLMWTQPERLYAR